MEGAVHTLDVGVEVGVDRRRRECNSYYRSFAYKKLLEIWKSKKI